MSTQRLHSGLINHCELVHQQSYIHNIMADQDPPIIVRLPLPPYQPIGEDVNAPPDLSELNTITQILHWIGFTIQAQRDNIVTDSFGAYNDIKMLNEKDIASMSIDWASRTQQNGRIHFGIRRTKLLKALTHWVQDFYRVSSTPTIEGLDKEAFLSQLHRAINRAEIPPI